MNNNNMKVQNNLREYRLRAGLSQFDVMIKLGFRSTDRVSKWENGNGIPGVVNLFKLTQIYQTTPQNLFPHISDLLENHESFIQTDDDSPIDISDQER